MASIRKHFFFISQNLFFVSELLKQFNIDMTAADIIDVFDEVNTDTTEINGQQVIDEKEFLDFYNSLLEREVLQIIFGQVLYKGFF